MRIIPAIDIIDGKCVRLSEGNYNTQKVYSENPLEIAKAFEDHGLQYLHLVDLDGAKSGKITNHKVLELLSSKTNLKIDFGGGIKSDEAIKIAFESGASQITGGSIAVNDEALFINWLNIYGADKVILGADTKNGKIAVAGWQEQSEELLLPFIKKYRDSGIDYVICTDITKDGMLQGPGFDIYKEILSDVSDVKLIASGGISEFDELSQLEAIGCEAVIIGKAIYENRISLKQLEKYITGQYTI